MARTKRFTSAEIEALKRRKGAARRSAVPADALEALNRGLVETVNLVEWLAVDVERLLRETLRRLDLRPADGVFEPRLQQALALGTVRRHEAIGELLFESFPAKRERTAAFKGLAGHESDIVRGWANHMLRADSGIDLAERLARTVPFASDRHFGVREGAWSTLRPYLIRELDRGLKLLEEWVGHPDANIRRCAVEGTRPKGVWCAQIAELRERPERAEPLLEPVRSDPSRYVQLAVGNWLNDASKSRPDWVREVCRRWRRESPTAQTDAIVRRGLRTLEPKQAKTNR